jgi:hypothetical protein
MSWGVVAIGRDNLVGRFIRGKVAIASFPAIDNYALAAASISWAWSEAGRSRVKKLLQFG